jgi:lysophospholipase L1-like esterase
MRILVFGDSIAYGAWAQTGWVERIKQEAHTRTIASAGKTKLQVCNLGVGSDSSTEILFRLENEIENRRSPSWPLVLVFSFGTNDAQLLDGRARTPVELFEENIASLIAAARNYTDKILFVGPPPISLPVVTFKGKDYADDQLKSYEQRLKSIVAGSNGIPYSATRPAFEKAGLDTLYSYDQIHPNDEGHRLIAALVLSELDKVLGGGLQRNNATDNGSK